jgi:hypothetical protein
MGLLFSEFSSNRNGLRRPAGWGLALLCLIASTGCQGVKTDAIASQRAFIDFAGLGPVTNFRALGASGSVPLIWDPLPLKENSLYSHEQWRSPTLTTGVGIAFIHLPFPLPAGAVLWFAQREYTARESDGRSLGRWTDDVGRDWFAAENKRFYVRGYVITRGMDAWIVYCGYRRANAPKPYEFSLAVRSMETIVPGNLSPKATISIANSSPRLVGSALNR